MGERASGVVMHISSLPSDFGIGDMGPWAFRFADILAAAVQRYWQVLPLNPTDQISDNSPYSSVSAMAGNPLLISPELLLAWGLLRQEDICDVPPFPRDKCRYEEVIPYKRTLMEKAFSRFGQSHPLRGDYDSFCELERDWLDDYALFISIKRKSGGRAWVDWPKGLKWRDPDALDSARLELAREMELEKFLQFLFFRQWRDLREHCAKRGILLIGDIPIYVNHDSVDVWTNPHLFQLDEDGNPMVVAGVPPDYFSPTGQRWGNPLYRWDRLEETGFDWWLRRIAHNLRFLDRIRVDHFRGLVGYWEIPASEQTAVKGRWVKAPGREFLEAVLSKFPRQCLIAEDLGSITQDVTDLMKAFGIPGMKVLQFAFSGDFPENPYLPHNHEPNCVVYTGTHDNNTLRGWFETEATKDERDRLFRYLGKELSSQRVPQEMMRLAMMSVADLAVVPFQDVLGLGQEARMNTPSTPRGNWRWRLPPESLREEHLEFLKELSWTYGRASGSEAPSRELEGSRESPMTFVWPFGHRESAAGQWPGEPVIYEIPTWTWLVELGDRLGKTVTLDTVPAQEWDRIASLGVDGVWLMGVWERSPVSARMAWEDPLIREECREALGALKEGDLVGSPYSVKRYVVDQRLGGPRGLARAREMLAQRGIRLILDFVPNHLAPDHPWVSEHPDYFVQGSREDLQRAPGSYMGVAGKVFAKGRDPFFPPWGDTVQLNAFQRGYREEALRTLKEIADQCDGIRCDMAMLLLEKVFTMTWGEKARRECEGEFWEEVIPRFKESHPRTLLVAEVYWGLEEELLRLGFDLCYDKVLYDRLVHDAAPSVMEHLRASLDTQRRLLRFLENHDEKRASVALPLRRHRAAALVLCTVPGAKLYHHGQLQGRRVRVPIQLGKAPNEAPNAEVEAMYRELLGLGRRVSPHTHMWSLCQIGGWPDNPSYQNLMAWAWDKAVERFAAIVNFSNVRSQGMVRMPWLDMAGKYWALHELLSGELYRRDGSQMLNPGLFVDLPPWGAHLFRMHL